MKEYTLPDPIIDAREEKMLEDLTRRFEQITSPSFISKTGKRVSKVAKRVARELPSPVRHAGSAAAERANGVVDAGRQLANDFEVDRIYFDALERMSEMFVILQEQTAKYTINRAKLVEQANAYSSDNDITGFDEFCLVRAYDLRKAAPAFRAKNFFAAVAEGGGFGYIGFAGLPFSLVASMFMCFRAVQAIAMRYGYDVKNSDEELVISATVLANSLSPRQGADLNELSGAITKVMLFAEFKGVQQAAGKQWAEVIGRGGIGLLLAQMRALANKAAAKALEKAGKKGLEESVFKGVFEQIGRRLTLKSVGKAMPVASAVVGAAFDSTTVNSVIRYAEIFYQKRFILEKADNIALLVSGTTS